MHKNNVLSACPFERQRERERERERERQRDRERAFSMLEDDYPSTLDIYLQYVLNWLSTGPLNRATINPSG